MLEGKSCFAYGVFEIVIFLSHSSLTHHFLFHSQSKAVRQVLDLTLLWNMMLIRMMRRMIMIWMLLRKDDE